MFRQSLDYVFFDFTVEADDRSVSRNGIDFTGIDVGLGYVCAESDAAGIIMFYNDSRRIFKFPEECHPGIYIKVIVIGHLLSLKGYGSCNTRLPVHRSLLMRIFPYLSVLP